MEYMHKTGLKLELKSSKVLYLTFRHTLFMLHVNSVYIVKKLFKSVLLCTERCNDRIIIGIFLF